MRSSNKYATHLTEKRVSFIKKLFTSVLIFVLFTSPIVNIPVVSTKTDVAEAYQVLPLTGKVMNPSFEEPYVVTSSHSQVFVLNSQVPYWVTESAMLLCQRSGGIVPSDGGQFLDFQTKTNGGLVYQDISAPPGTVYTWSLDYIANPGEAMNLYIGAPNETVAPIVVEPDTSTYDWQRHTGTYQVPAGQPVTRIAFSANDDIDGFNAIDNLQFSTAPTATMTPKTVPVGATVVASDLLKDPLDQDNLPEDPDPTFSFPKTEENPNGLAPSTLIPGVYPTMVRVTDEEGHYTDYEVDLTVGSAPPTGTAKTDLTVPIGTDPSSLDAADFVTDVVDTDGEGEVAISFAETPDTSVAGETTFKVKLVDDEGETAVINVTVMITRDFIMTEKYQDESGATIMADSETIVQGGNPYDKTAPAIADYVYLGYRLASDAISVPIHTGNPSLTNVESAETVTMIYGQDDTNNGKVDVTINEKYVDEAGISRATDTTQTIDKGDDYSKVAPVIDDHIYMGYRLDSDQMVSIGNPSIEKVQAPHTVTMVYGKDDDGNGIVDSQEVTITEKYQDRSGKLLKADTAEKIDKNSPAGYSKETVSLPDIEGYVYEGYKLASEPDGVGLHTDDPATILGPIASDTGITYVYAQDENGNGTEDVNITEKYVDESGRALRDATTQVVDIGDAYTGTPATIEGYTYQKYKLDTGEDKTGEPSILDVQASTTVTMVYSQNGGTVDRITVSEKYIDENETEIMAPTSTDVKVGADYNLVAPEIENYIYKGYKVDGDEVLHAGNPSLTNVEASQIVTMVYAKDGDGTGIIDGQEIVVTEKYVDQSGNAISGQENTTVKVDKNSEAGYLKSVTALKTIPGYQYAGYKLAGETAEETLHTSDPIHIAGPITSDTDITFVYKQDLNGKEPVVITENYVDELGVTVKEQTTQYVDNGSAYSKTAQSIKGYTYLGYRVDGEVTILTGDPVITNVTSTQNITFVYRQDQNVVPPVPSKGIPKTDDSRNLLFGLMLISSLLLLFAVRRRKSNKAN